jgi:hypothetical protein
MTKARDRRIAEEIAHELQRVLGPILPEELAENRDAVCGVFDRVFDRHRIVNEDVGARILARVPKELARLNLQYVETNRRLNVAVAETVHSGDATPTFRIVREFVDPEPTDEALAK